MKIPMELWDLIIHRVKLNKKNYMKIEDGVFLLSNATLDSPAKPVFAEKVVPSSKRDEQWQRIKEASADQKLCMIFKNKHDYNKWIKGCDAAYKKSIK